MTLNAIIRRLQTISLAHKLIRSFQFGSITDFLNEKTSKYPAALLQDTGGNIGIASRATAVSFKLFLVDLVHVSDETKQNEVDVFSDTLSIAEDIIALIDNDVYQDWAISTDNTITLVREEFGDMVAGAAIDFTIRTPYAKDKCSVPTDLVAEINQEDMKLIYDTSYTATGSEGSTLSIPELVGKKIVFMTRENNIIYKVSSNPASSEYTWDNTDIGLGTVTNPGDRFLILYRNY